MNVKHYCGGTLAFETICGIRVYRVIKGKYVCNAVCSKCGLVQVTLDGRKANKKQKH